MKRTRDIDAYRQTLNKVIERADNRCEVFVDEDGKACTDKPKKRCFKYITSESATWTNFLHKETRNGKSNEWVNDPNNIVFGCAEHHYEEERTGRRVEFFEYGDEPIYLPDNE